MDRGKQKDGWMDIKMVGWMDKTNRWMVGRKENKNMKKNRWMVGWMDRKKQMDGWMDKKQMDGWIEKKQMKKQMDG